MQTASCGLPDYFFDGLFTDWAMMDQIGRVLVRLDGMQREMEQEQAQIRNQLNILVLETKICCDM